MRLSILSLAAVVLLSSFVLAQHSSGGGGNSGGSSAGSSGVGSHSSSSGGGSYSSGSGGGHASGGGYSSGGGHNSGGNHVSNGAGSRGSSSPSPASRGTGSAMFSRSDRRTSIANETRTNRSLSHSSQLRTAPPEKRSFFSFLRHPFRRPQSNHVADLRHYICTNEHCNFCPVGQVRMGNACIGGVVPRYDNYCSRDELWSGGSCLLHTYFLPDCSGLLMALQRQEQRVQAADSIRQSACMNGATPECLGATRERESEENLYQSLESRYRRCQTSAGNAYFLGGHASSGHASSLWIDPSRLDLAP